MKKILTFFGIILNGEYQKIVGQRDSFRELSIRSGDELARVKMELTKAQSTLAMIQARPVVAVHAKDPSPIDVEARKLYVGRVAGFHTEILSPKLTQLIADGRGQFEELNRQTFGLSQEQYDLFLKGTLNGLWLIHEWGAAMVNEQVANQQPETITEEETAGLKAKLKE